MLRVYEIFIPELGTYVKFKFLPPNDIDSFVESGSNLTKDEFLKYVLDNIVYNMKPDVVESLKMMSRATAHQTLQAMYNGCVMLNPGLDIDTWVRLCFMPLSEEDEIYIEKDIPQLLDEARARTFEQPALPAPKKARAKTNKISKAKFLNLNKYLKEKVIGQDEAIDSVVAALKRSQTGLNDDQRPLGVFLFAGSSGVGKTHLARELHKYLYGDEYDIVRVDCGEYQHKHENQKLLGSPPGYLGHDEGGHLTNQVKDHPDTVILLDEVEKAHPDIWNTFLRIFDEGMLTDNKGKPVNFRNTIIIMTTNLGNDKVVEAMTGKQVGFGGRGALLLHTKDIPPRMHVERLANEAIKKMFRPEFLNRIDKEIIFNHLTYEDFVKIAELELAVVEDKLAKRGIVLKFDEKVLNTLIEIGVDSIKGARGMAQVRREKIEDKLADILLETRCPRGTIFELVTIKDNFGVNIRRPRKQPTKDVTNG